LPMMKLMSAFHAKAPGPLTRVGRYVEIEGIVQGVGFRPFIYRLANAHQLDGEVCNTSRGVSIHIAGTGSEVEAFCGEITEKSPPLAQISNIRVASAPFVHWRGFAIADSHVQSSRDTLISPDIAICQDCLAELFDSDNRRFGYPFINCTNCGPRYSIIEDVPYDRPYTSMKGFTMCRQCHAEYNNPENRRFHAQPNACPICGPQVALYDHRGDRILADDAVKRTIYLLRQGFIMAIKGLGGFHLACDAQCHEAVLRLRRRKHREEKPLAMMSYDINKIRSYAFVGHGARQVLESARRPIVLLKKKFPNTISEAVAPQNKYFGVMLPYTPLHYLLLHDDFTALVMTSANLSDEPIIKDNGAAFMHLSSVADYFLIHDRRIYQRSDDSVVAYTAGSERIIRRSRGYVPAPVFLDKNVGRVLACGGELKNTICLTKSNRAFLSQHIGDLKNMGSYAFFRSTIDHLKRILDIDPDIIAHDLHPDYLSTQYARENEQNRLVGVQHHHAHIASCMAEHQLRGPVIGLALDGTGYGTDGHIWGGEVLITEMSGFQRAGHLEYMPMPGGAAAITEPWRMAIAFLVHTFGENSFMNLNLPVLQDVDDTHIQTMAALISKRLNAPLTSSVGRLFDGVVAILGLSYRISYEGQAAITLEMKASDNVDGIYDYGWKPTEPVQVQIKPIIRGIVGDMQNGVAIQVISRKFHNTLIHLFADLCVDIGRRHGLNRVVLSGGVFQNSILLCGMIAALEKQGFEVFSHRLVPCNDGGISLGQAVVAAEHPFSI